MNGRMRRHQQAFAGGQCASLSPLQLAICGCFVQKGSLRPNRWNRSKLCGRCSRGTSRHRLRFSATSNYREGVNPELPLVVMKGAQRECASLSGFFKVVRCVERHTNVNSGSSLWLRINHKRPADQPNSLLHARKTQTSLSPCCFNVESSA